MASCRKRSRTAIAIAASGTSFTQSYTFEGEVLTRYLLECYDATAVATRTLSIVDANSKTIWTGAAHTDASTNSIPVDIELDGVYTFTITLDTAATGTGGTDYLTLFTR